jgi:hypothetical protein
MKVRGIRLRTPEDHLPGGGDEAQAAAAEQREAAELAEDLRLGDPATPPDGDLDALVAPETPADAAPTDGLEDLVLAELDYPDCPAPLPAWFEG